MLQDMDKRQSFMLLNAVNKSSVLSCSYSSQLKTAGLRRSWQYSWTCLESGGFIAGRLLGSTGSANSSCYYKVALTMVVTCTQQG